MNISKQLYQRIYYLSSTTSMIPALYQIRIQTLIAIGVYFHSYNGSEAFLSSEETHFTSGVDKVYLVKMKSIKTKFLLAAE